MHASDALATLPTAHLSDPVLSVAKVVAEPELPGCVVVDGDDRVIGCLTSLDLLWLAEPRYLDDAPLLANVFSEEQADRIAEQLMGTRIGDILDLVNERIPWIRPEATIVEVVHLLVSRSTDLLLVKDADSPTALGVITADRALEVLLNALEGSTS
jgi:CBS domain-containing protein